MYIVIITIIIYYHCYPVISHCIPSYPIPPACQKTRPSRPKRSKLGVAIRPWGDSAG